MEMKKKKLLAFHCWKLSNEKKMRKERKKRNGKNKKSPQCN